MQLERGDTKPKGCTEAPKGGSINFTLDASGNLGEIPRRDLQPRGGWFVTSGKLGSWLLGGGFPGLRLENTEVGWIDYVNIPEICFFFFWYCEDGNL